MQWLVVALVLGAQWAPVAGVVGAAAVTAAGAWGLARRRESGGIHTSQAGELWTAFDGLLERVTSDNTTLRAELAAERAETGRLRERIAVLESEVRRLRGLVNGT